MLTPEEFCKKICTIINNKADIDKSVRDILKVVKEIEPNLTLEEENIFIDFLEAKNFNLIHIMSILSQVLKEKNPALSAQNLLEMSEKFMPKIDEADIFKWEIFSEIDEF